MKLEEEIEQKHFRNEYHKAAVNVIYTFNWIINQQISFFKPFGVTVQQFNILRILRGQHPNPATIKLIKERMLDKMSDASRIVEKLRIKGLVERNICSHDRRNVDVCITQKGLDLLSEIDKYDDEADKKLALLNKEEIKQLNDLLDKLRG
jgi:DNA-binding MarR family transcriptional regulator